MVSQKDLVKLANKWKINYTQEYRMATCADCGDKVIKMWHCWLDDGGYKKEIHLCMNCFKKYE